MDYTEQFGKNLRELRKEKGISQERLSEYLDVSRQTITNWECGRSSPSIEDVVKLSRLLGVTLEELLIGECPAVLEATAVDAEPAKKEEPMRQAVEMSQTAKIRKSQVLRWIITFATTAGLLMCGVMAIIYGESIIGLIFPAYEWMMRMFYTICAVAVVLFLLLGGCIIWWLIERRRK